ncbi:hypothetical protein CHS0354_041988 [Potamilus streckersoni]|uniref:Ig-like domain-containing protein n=1 Tax=Potamilus streckersoni TaxID=2493646 RepID=A0AAE0T9N2_9BIVA|nr:hypothetical protein CHS0354_041988 [Potamilus streckersoni]
MLTQLIFLVLVLPLPVRCQTYTWAYSTYLDVEFSFSCNDTRILLTNGEIVKWKTPQHKELKQGHNDSDYLVVDSITNTGQDLVIKRVRNDLSGIYVCMVYNNGSLRKSAIRGLNIYKPLYHNLGEMYIENVIVAVITAVVFLVPLITMCAIYKFRYMTKEEKTRKNEMKRKYQEMISQHYGNTHNNHPHYDDLSEMVKAKDIDGSGGYDNPVVTAL